MQATKSDHKAQSFWDRIAPKYARKPIADPDAYERKLALLGSLFCVEDRILEIGCGTGSTALRIAERVAHVTATDISRGMIDIANEKLTNDTNTNVVFQQAAAHEMIAGHPFDGVCGFSLLHLVDDIPQVLTSVRAQLRSGGLLVCKTVCTKDTIWPIGTFISVLRLLGLAPKVTELSADELVAHLQTAGFEVEQMTYFGSGRINPFIVARKSSPTSIDIP